MVALEALESILPFLTGLFSLAMVIYSLRVLTSRNLGDAVLAIDALTVDLIVLMVLVALHYRSPYLLIGVIPLAAWILILDLAVARYLEKRWIK
ncbi:MAG: MrpF/PhaF family protein [Thermosphaera aggregans]|jgi:multicomponent Na+:H+ antiporter subunit F|uniref:MrpF/PhaF family protein n=1 Tax=Thermosphaera aggregans TaxID=54254 RepID=UPI003BFB11B3